MVVGDLLFMGVHHSIVLAYVGVVCVGRRYCQIESIVWLFVLCFE